MSPRWPAILNHYVARTSDPAATSTFSTESGKRGTSPDHLHLTTFVIAFFASRSNAESANISIPTGSGPRALVAGGRLHPRYRIYVPKSFVPVPDVEVAADA